MYHALLHYLALLQTTWHSQTNFYSCRLPCTPADYLALLQTNFYSCRLSCTPADYLALLQTTWHSCKLTFTPADYLALLQTTLHSCRLPCTPADYLALLHGYEADGEQHDSTVHITFDSLSVDL